VASSRARSVRKQVAFAAGCNATKLRQCPESPAMLEKISKDEIVIRAKEIVDALLIK
jgi:hypothetical protein